MWDMVRSTLGPSLVLTLLLSSLSVAAPAYNARETAPRTVFLQLPADQPEPEVRVMATALPDGAVQIALETRHFRFTDICVAEAVAQPLGHAHILVDGIKVASAYQPILRIEGLGAGRHELRAVLRGQDHRALLGAKGLIEARIIIEVPA